MIYTVSATEKLEVQGVRTLRYGNMKLMNILCLMCRVGYSAATVTITIDVLNRRSLASCLMAARTACSPHVHEMLTLASGEEDTVRRLVVRKIL